LFCHYSDTITSLLVDFDAGTKVLRRVKSPGKRALVCALKLKRLSQLQLPTVENKHSLPKLFRYR
jgi:hypothetical protein